MHKEIGWLGHHHHPLFVPEASRNYIYTCTYNESTDAISNRVHDDDDTISPCKRTGILFSPSDTGEEEEEEEEE